MQQTVKLLKGLVVGCLAHQELPLVLVFTQVYYYVKFSIFFIEEIFSSCFRKGCVGKLVTYCIPSCFEIYQKKTKKR